MAEGKAEWTELSILLDKSVQQGRVMEVWVLSLVWGGVVLVVVQILGNIFGDIMNGIREEVG